MSSSDVKSAGAAARYGNAMFELAAESKALAKTEKELLALTKMLAASPALAEAAASPLVGAQEKAALFADLAKKAKFSKLTANFLGVVCENGRAGELSDMVNAYMAQSAAAKGHVRASATTAIAMTATQKKNLSASLKNTLGHNVELETDVDPDLLGGLIVQVGSRMYDSSLKTQLNGLKLAMKEN